MHTLLHLGFSHAQPVVVVLAAIATFAVGLWVGMSRWADSPTNTRLDEEGDR